jgi:hypothetical protein
MDVPDTNGVFEALCTWNVPETRLFEMRKWHESDPMERKWNAFDLCQNVPPFPDTHGIPATCYFWVLHVCAETSLFENRSPVESLTFLIQVTVFAVQKGSYQINSLAQMLDPESIEAESAHDEIPLNLR